MARTMIEPRETTFGLLWGQEHQPVPLCGVAYDGLLCGTALRLRVIQRYRNEEDKPIEAMYLFPVPEGAAVCGLTVTLGDRALRAVVEERDKAFDLYDEAMGRGDTAVLLDQERPNVFQMSVGNLLPGEEAVVEVRLVMDAKPDGGEIRLMIPTTISPRYNPVTADPAVRVEIERTTPPYAASVPYGLTVALEMEMASDIRSVSSESHPVEVTVTGSRATVRLAQRETAMDRDFVLKCRTAALHEASALAASDHGRDHVAVTLLPELEQDAEPAPRRVVFLVDCSGSMQGDSIGEARRAVELCLRALRAGDRFQIVRFGSSFHSLSAGLLEYSQETLDDAVARVRMMEADLGGTEILRPLRHILSNAGEDRLDVVVLTDGQVGNEAEVLELARQHRDRCRIFSFGIGAGCSEHLVRGLARESGGESEFIFPGERIEPKVLRQFARIDTPLLQEVEIDWGGLPVEAAPARIPPVFAGDALVVTARLVSDEMQFPDGAVVRLSAVTPAGRKVWTAVVKRAGQGDVIPLLWARRRIRDLESGFGAPSGSSQRRQRPRGQREMVDLSMEYGLLCSETSFVGVIERPDGQKAGGPAEARRVPVMTTAGWHGLGGILPGVFAKSAPSAGRPFIPGPGVLYSMPTMAAGEPCYDKEVSRCMPSGFSDMVMDRSEKRKSTRFPKADASSRYWYLGLLALQQADGSFPLGQELADWAGRKLRELRAWVRKLSPGGSEAESVLATALALVLLEKKAADASDQWQAAAAKARVWLANHRSTLEGLPVEDWLRRNLK